MFALNWIGGGDAKLIAATSLWMGFNVHLAEYLVTSTVLGGILTLAILSYRGSVLAAYTGHNRFLRHLSDKSVGIPYGIALAIGALMIYPETEWIKAVDLVHFAAR